MPLTKLEFRPGINRETTSYANEGGWFDCDKIRFRGPVPEKIGGWVQKTVLNSFLGTSRALHAFVSLSGDIFTGIGTTVKYYIEEGGTYNDVTPIRLTTAAGDVTFAASNGSSTITVTEESHGAVANDFVTFSGAASLGGNITANVLNQEYQITEIVNGNSYKIEARTESTIPAITVNGALSPTLVTASASDSGNGGGSVVGTYQVNSGLDTTVLGTGWGASTWGRGTWGSSASIAATGAQLRIWTHDSFGEDLLINIRNGDIFRFDTSAGVTTRAVSLSSISSDATTPTIAKQVMVSDRDRHVIVFGCDGETSIGTQDPLLIRFSSQESLTTWKSEVTNTAGELRLGSGSEIVTAVETRQQILVFTDVSLHAMQFIGPPFTFGISQLSENITIQGPLAAKAVDDFVFWMGKNDFYVYSGQVQKLPCSVKAYVFNDFNTAQSEKVFAALNSSFSEIWWFYCSSSADEVDRYVIYNYETKLWYFGTLSRTAWIDRGINDNPIAASTTGRLFLHEVDDDDGSTDPATAITAYVESSQLSIGEGNNFVFLRRLIPDVTFDGSTASGPSANFTLKTRRFPGANYDQTNTEAITRSATVPVEQFTTEKDVRLRGRSFALRVESTAAGVKWRLGVPRVDVRQDGRR
tara:strand:+ start:125 stop:2044 length:1920 start_codon:yes stop_codon:yes gene_type:complete